MENNTKEDSQQKIEPDFSDIKVEFKTIFGIKPRIYIGFLYIASLVALLYLFCIYPGVKNSGSYYKIDTNIQGASVYYDDKFLGSTPLKTLIPSGKHAIYIKKPFYKIIKKEMVIKPDIFFTLFFKKYHKFNFEIELEKPVVYAKETVKEFSKYSTSISSNQEYIIPKIITPFIKELYKSAYKNKDDLALKVLSDCIKNISSKELAGDFLNALKIYLNKGRIFDLSFYPRLILFLLSNKFNTNDLTEALQKLGFENSKFFKKIQKFKKPIKDTLYTKNTDLDSQVNMYNIPFTKISGGNYKLNNFKDKNYSNFIKEPIKKHVNEFYIQNNEMSYQIFAKFLQDEPKYQKSNIKNLIEEGFVDEDYLLLKFNDNMPVSYVSYYVVKEFVKWFNEKISDSGFEANLPSKYEFELASLVWQGKNNIFYNNDLKETKPINYTDEVLNLRGSLWEFTNTDFGFLNDVFNQKNNYKFSKISIMGGSFATKKDDVDNSTIGIYEKYWTSPIAGFRLVLHKKQ